MQDLESCPSSLGYLIVDASSRWWFQVMAEASLVAHCQSLRNEIDLPFKNLARVGSWEMRRPFGHLSLIPGPPIREWGVTSVVDQV
jgi:hypothetical protein